MLTSPGPDPAGILETGHKMKVVQPLLSIRIWFKEPGFMTLLMSLHLPPGQTYL